MRRAALLLASLALAPGALALPEQVHLGLPSSDAAHEASVLWFDSAPETEPAIRIQGPEGPRLVAAQAVPGPSAGFAYEARLDRLLAGSEHTYQVGDRTFRLATAPDGPAPFRIVALGDMGTSERSRATARLVQELAPDVVLHAGDISYAQGDPTVWKAWFDMVEPVAANRPWLTAHGNHETYTGPGIVGGAAGQVVASPAEEAFYKQRFGLPGNELWYSFDWAGAHVVALATFGQPLEGTSPGPPAEEVAWLDQDLAAHANATWTIVFLHEPAYSSNLAHGSSARVQQAFVPLFEEHGVDLVIAGHDHSYERTFPLRGGERVGASNGTSLQGEGVVYLVTGGAGQGLYRAWAEPSPPWSAARKDLFHVTLLTVTNDSIEGRVVPSEATGFADAFRIARSALAAPPPTQEGARPTPDLASAALLALALAAVRRLRSSR